MCVSTTRLSVVDKGCPRFCLFCHYTLPLPSLLQRICEPKPGEKEEEEKRRATKREGQHPYYLKKIIIIIYYYYYYCFVFCCFLGRVLHMIQKKCCHLPHIGAGGALYFHYGQAYFETEKVYVYAFHVCPKCILLHLNLFH